MKVRRYNKATATVIAGAAVSILGAVLELDKETLMAIQTRLGAVLVVFVPNKSE